MKDFFLKNFLKSYNTCSIKFWIIFQTRYTSLLKNNKLAIAIMLSYCVILHFFIFVWLSPFFMWQYPVIMWRYPIFVWHSPFFVLDIQNFVDLFLCGFVWLSPFFVCWYLFFVWHYPRPSQKLIFSNFLVIFVNYTKIYINPQN